MPDTVCLVTEAEAVLIPAQGASSSEGVTGDSAATNNVFVFKALAVWVPLNSVR